MTFWWVERHAQGGDPYLVITAAAAGVAQVPGSRNQCADDREKRHRSYFPHNCPHLLSHVMLCNECITCPQRPQHGWGGQAGALVD